MFHLFFIVIQESWRITVDIAIGYSLVMMPLYPAVGIIGLRILYIKQHLMNGRMSKYIQITTVYYPAQVFFGVEKLHKGSCGRVRFIQKILTARKDHGHEDNDVYF